MAPDEDHLSAAARDPFRPELGAAPEDDLTPRRSGRRRSHPDADAAAGTTLAATTSSRDRGR